ncbi:MAG: chromate efflux transporter [Sphingobacteriales bacterium]|nr:MAG: chromate efflux transporter [Sphingobacteriales bacterium]
MPKKIPNANLTEVARVFFKLGCIGFGGPAAHIAMMEKEVVQKRQWITREHFVDLIGATNLIPGPNSTELTMHCGHERAGWKGLIVAGTCFISPAVIITSVFAWAYQQYGHLPQVAPFIYGIKPAIIAVIISAIIPLAKTAFKTIELWVIAILCTIAVLAGADEILVLFGAGAVGILLHMMRNCSETLNSIIPLSIVPLSHTSVFLKFLKVGSILYGSGYVLFAFLDAELVQTNIISKQILIDAIAVGQFTPGPVFSSATFIGWQISGFGGAVAATIGIFLPSFLFVALLNPIIPKLRKSKIMSAFLDTVNVASVAIILAVCVEMAKYSISDWRTILIACLSLLVVFRFRSLNTSFVIVGGAVLGYVLSLF